jgi:hypothetical protein
LLGYETFAGDFDLSFSGKPQFISGSPEKPGKERQQEREKDKQAIGYLQPNSKERRPEFRSFLSLAAIIASIALIGRDGRMYFALALFLDVTQRWSRLSEQNLRVDKWSLCRG